MGNPIIDAERMIGHGLDPAGNPWVKRVVRKTGHKLNEEAKSWAAATHDESTKAANDNIPIPLQKLLLEELEKQNANAQQSDAQKHVAEAVAYALKQLLPPEAMLYVPLDDFQRIHHDLQLQAQALVKETIAVTGKNATKLPINQEALRHNLQRHLHSPKCRDRHYELFSAISRTQLPHEIGTARVTPR